jgi:uncharacterized protein YecE (DUF72 family)
MRIGISGWNYPGWRGVFYPKGLAQRRELEYASRRFNSIEINGTFYSLQRPEYFEAWYRTTPEDFRFAVKGSRFITHMKKLNDIKAPLANFFASGVLCLKEKLGPILWQFGPNWPLDLERFETFLDLLPASTAAAARLARRHDDRLEGRAWTRADHDRPIRHAVEVRHPSFFSMPFVRLLRRHRVALVIADTAEKFPYAEDVTAGFVYLRLHGTGQIYAGGYSGEQLDAWVSRIEAWKHGREPRDARRIDDRPARTLQRRDVYVYFDNDAKVKAPFDALELASRLGVNGETERLEPPGDALLAPSMLTERELAGRRAESGRRCRARPK